MSGDRGEPDNGLRFWQVLAVVGLIAATAGWTTAAVLALRPSATPAPIAEASSPPDDALPSDEPSLEPPVESHAVADLEALLPTAVNGTSLTRESWTGDTVLGDDSWSTSITTFLTSVGKTAADLQASQAYDGTGNARPERRCLPRVGRRRRGTARRDHRRVQGRLSRPQADHDHDRRPRGHQRRLRRWERQQLLVRPRRRGVRYRDQRRVDRAGGAGGLTGPGCTRGLGDAVGERSANGRADPVIPVA